MGIQNQDSREGMVVQKETTGPPKAKFPPHRALIIQAGLNIAQMAIKVVTIRMRCTLNRQMNFPVIIRLCSYRMNHIALWSWVANVAHVFQIHAKGSPDFLINMLVPAVAKYKLLRSFRLIALQSGRFSCSQVEIETCTRYSACC